MPYRRETMADTELGNKGDPLDQFRRLDRELSRYDALYYGQASPEISDNAYDQLKKKWQEILHAHPHFFRFSRHNAVGDDRQKGFQKVRHSIPMLSLSNSYDNEDVKVFLRQVYKCVGQFVTFSIEPKIDGLAVAVIYENGILRRAITRGNGQEGDDVTHNVATIENLPQKIPANAPQMLEIRGEVYICLEDFHRLNGKRRNDGLEEFANARNLAAGSLKLLDPSQARERCLQFIAYEMGICSKKFSNHEDVLAAIASWEIPTNRHWHAIDYDGIWSAIELCDRERSSYEFATDGAVIKINEHCHRECMGSIASAPRWAMAYKYAPKKVTTRLLSIELQVGRTGIVAPIAHLQPVHLDGSTIRKATLHNGDEIARKDIREGDEVIVQKAGEVIPAIVGVVLANRPIDCQPFTYPSRCPACGKTIYQFDGEVAYRCINPNCPPQIIRRLAHFASKEAMEIYSLGTQRILLLRNAGLLREFSDIYRLSQMELLQIPRMGEKSASILLNAIEKSKQQPLWRLLHGLGIPQVGVQTAKLLAKHWPSMHLLIDATIEELCICETIGETIATSIVSFFQDISNRRLISKLSQLGISMGNDGTASNGNETLPLSGQVFAITGSFRSYSREELREAIERRGGMVRSAISKNVHTLLMGANGGSKVHEAQRLGIPIIPESELHSLLGG